MWTEIKVRIKNEPVLLSNLLGATISVLAAFGFNLTLQQAAMLTGFILTLTTVLLGRPNVTPSSKVVAFMDTKGTLQAGTGSAARSEPGHALLSTQEAKSSLRVQYVGKHRGS